MTAEFLFNAANIFVLPFWTLMVVLPNWAVTKRVMSSFWPYIILALVYFYLFVAGITPESAEEFASAGLSDIAWLFSQEQFAATAWVHFVVIDLFTGRWIYRDGLELNVFTRHSLVLCLFAGPLGLLSHILTRSGVQWFRSRQASSEAAVTEDSASSVVEGSS
ncbi:MAG: ABA4-like family protein [Leptolyngbyaceae bacterium]|nr:ABA4-like family protein [Leptolyngbyaceae bacterium]